MRKSRVGILAAVSPGLKCLKAALRHKDKIALVATSATDDSTNERQIADFAAQHGIDGKKYYLKLKIEEAQLAKETESPKPSREREVSS